MRLLAHGAIVVFLTLLTQIGGLAWIFALCVRKRVIGFLVAYSALWLGAFHGAPLGGREALPCFGDQLRAQSAIYCLMSRHYTTPEMRNVVTDAASEMAERFPGTRTLALDAGFPFFDGFPMLPHLSHDDGEKLDLAFYYQGPDQDYLPGLTRSWIGYWAFESLSDNICPDQKATLRWDLRWMQRLWRDVSLEPVRTRDLIGILAEDARVAKLFVEPPLLERLGMAHPKLSFQGCRAARHDDHIHLQL